MSLSGKIMELFGSTPQPAISPNPQAQQMQQQQVAATPNNQNTTIPNGTQPVSDGSVAAFPKTATGEASPMAGYEKLWETTATTKDLSSPVPAFNIDLNKQLTDAKKVDFTQFVSKEALEKAAKGDSTALAQIVNEAAQAGFGMSTTSTATLVQQALQSQADKFRNEYLPELLRRHDAGRELRAGSPVLADPTIAPLVSMVETQFARQYPQATAVQIKDHAAKYMAGVGKLLATPSSENTPVVEKKEPVLTSKAGDNWENFFSM